MSIKDTGHTGLVRQCLDYLALKGILAWQNDTVGIWDAARKCYRTRKGRRGMSDILGVLDGGTLLAVECKTGTGRLTPEQRTFIDAVHLRGGVAVVVHRLDDLIEALERIEA